MSIEALAYAKQMDLDGAESAQARLLVYVIAENTFNDTFVCRLSQEQLAYEAGRVSERTVRRHLDALEAARLIVRPRAQRRAGGGHMLSDVIRLRGFKQWYARDHGRRKAGSPADKLSGGGANVSRGSRAATGGQFVRPPADTCCPPAAGQQVSGAYKDTRTSNPVPSGAHARSEGSNSVLEGKGVRDRLRITVGGPKFAEWLADMAFVKTGDAVTATTATQIKARWARQHFEKQILDACRAEWGHVRCVTIAAGVPPCVALAPAGPAAPGRIHEGGADAPSPGRAHGLAAGEVSQ